MHIFGYLYNYNNYEITVYIKLNIRNCIGKMTVMKKFRNHPTIVPPIVTVTVLFLLLWQFTFTIPDAGISVLIVFLHHALTEVHVFEHTI